MKSKDWRELARDRNIEFSRLINTQSIPAATRIRQIWSDVLAKHFEETHGHWMGWEEPVALKDHMDGVAPAWNIERYQRSQAIKLMAEGLIGMTNAASDFMDLKPFTLNK